MSLPAQTVGAFWDEMSKIASAKPALYGALAGAAAGGAHALRREGSLKAQEDFQLSTRKDINTPEVRKQLMKKRAIRVGKDLVLGAAAGGAIGHVGAKAGNSALDAAAAKFKKDIAPKLDNFAAGADRLSRAPDKIDAIRKDFKLWDLVTPRRFTKK